MNVEALAEELVTLPENNSSPLYTLEVDGHILHGMGSDGRHSLKAALPIFRKAVALALHRVLPQTAAGAELSRERLATVRFQAAEWRRILESQDQGWNLSLNATLAANVPDLLAYIDFLHHILDGEPEWQALVEAYQRGSADGRREALAEASSVLEV
jgi:hypothetical protein